MHGRLSWDHGLPDAAPELALLRKTPAVVADKVLASELGDLEAALTEAETNPGLRAQALSHLYAVIAACELPAAEP